MSKSLRRRSRLFGVAAARARTNVINMLPRNSEPRRQVLCPHTRSLERLDFLNIRITEFAVVISVLHGTTQMSRTSASTLPGSLCL